jgi:8-oxo-dGTP pyrophosphatase MutT (NUDIX family)
MAPQHRASTVEYLKDNPNPKKSCVLILFYPKENIPHVALTLRAEYKGAHSGQVSFPGGKTEETDQSLEYTALRETQEEIGIDLTTIAIVGKLTGLYIPVSGFWVYPFVGVMNHYPLFTLDVQEVKQLIEVPITEIMKDDIISTTRFKIRDNISIEAPCYTIQGHIVWGATAMILSELREIVRAIV